MEKTSVSYQILHDEIKSMATKTSIWSRENKKKSFNIYLFITIISALITILVAVGDVIPISPDRELLLKFLIKLLILILSGLSTILAAWDSFFNHKQLWINYGETRNKLKELLLEMELFSEADKLDADKVKIVFDKYENILEISNDKWTKLRNIENEKEKNK